MSDIEKDRPAHPESAATPPVASPSPTEESRFARWSKGLGERVKPFAAIGALVLLGWNANNYWRGDLKALKDDMTSKWTEDRKALQELKEEHENLRSYVKRHEEEALYQFYRMCSERGGIIDYEKRSCTEPNRHVKRTFELLDSATP
jgi:hypothetical protein